MQENVDTGAVREAIERRRLEWLDEYNRMPQRHSQRRAVLSARLQELAWVLRLIDGT